MIALLQNGTYQIIKTKHQNEILILDKTHSFAWIMVGDIGEILVASSKFHTAEYVIAQGQYKLYKVVNEPDLIDIIHLELKTGDKEWQGYLLPTGLPTTRNKRNRIIPTEEVITGRHNHLVSALKIGNAKTPM